MKQAPPPPQSIKALDEFQAGLAMQGDRRAFSLLHKRWQSRLLAHAYRWVQNREDARDVLQDSALALARNIHRLRDPRDFGPWAFTIVRRRAVDLVRRKHRARANTARFEREQSVRVQPVAVETDPRAATLRTLISELSPEPRELLRMFYVDGMSVGEIARCLQRPAGTVKSRLHAARAQLKTAYHSQNGEDHD